MRKGGLELDGDGCTIGRLQTPVQRCIDPHRYTDYLRDWAKKSGVPMVEF
jgi:hypothetical protein